MTSDAAAIRQRLGTGLIVGLLHLAVIYGLLIAFAGGKLVPGPNDLALVATFVTDQKPPPPPPPPSHPAHKKSGRDPRPPAPKAQAAPVVAAAIIPVMRPAPPTHVTGNGAQQNNGSALAGAGSGGGGQGSGNGSGSGDGDDDGGTDLRQIAGSITERDYPPEAVRGHESGRVHIRFTVGINGTVSDCVVTGSSGSPSLDAATCRLIIQRFRYEPSRDSHGRPYADTVEGEHDWRMGGRAADDQGDVGE